MNYRIEKSSGVYGTTPLFTGFYQKKNWFGKLVWKQVYLPKYRHGKFQRVYYFYSRAEVMKELFKILPYRTKVGTKVVESGIL
jgi:hypothetical protein